MAARCATLLGALCLTAVAGGSAWAQPAASAAAASAPAPTVQVNRFEVQGNTLLTEAAVTARLAEFKGNTDYLFERREFESLSRPVNPPVAPAPAATPKP